MNTPSDIMLVACGVAALAFTLNYGIFSPWWKSALGTIVFLVACSLDALLFLIIYAIAFDQKVAEPYRLVVATALFFALSAKAVIVSVERRSGRAAKRRRAEEEFHRDLPQSHHR